jgi:hypothetical protein
MTGSRGTSEFQLGIIAKRNHKSLALEGSDRSDRPPAILNRAGHD